MNRNFLRILACVTLLGFSFLPILSFSATYQLPAPGNDIIGENFITKAEKEDTLDSIGKRFEISMHEMIEANPTVKPNGYLTMGQEIVVPARFILPFYRQGIVVNLAELRLYYFTTDGKEVITYPVGLGRDEWRTPLATTTVVKKAEQPVWKVPSSIRRYVYQATGKILPSSIKPGPENPLGPYALYLGISGYLIHGTNQPNTIGKYVSSGCIRMNNNDVEDLFYRVKLGTPVYIVNHPYKAGWQNGQLYLEAQVPVEVNSISNDLNQLSWRTVLKQQETKVAAIDWKKAEQVVRLHTGIPTAVGQVSTSQAIDEKENKLE